MRLPTRVLSALIDLALPAECGGCGGSGLSWCPGCDQELRSLLFPVPQRVSPEPPPLGLPPVTSSGRYGGVLRRLVTAYKDEGRRDLAAVLAPPLRASLEAASDGARPPWLVVPVPSSRRATRQRGDVPVTELTRAALAETDFPTGDFVLTSLLRPVRSVADQARLGHADRALNLQGAYAVRPAWRGRLGSAPVLLVDDVITTGATLTEAARAVRAAGGTVLGAATLAATPRRHGGGR